MVPSSWHFFFLFLFWHFFFLFQAQHTARPDYPQDLNDLERGDDEHQAHHPFWSTPHNFINLQTRTNSMSKKKFAIGKKSSTEKNGSRKKEMSEAPPAVPAPAPWLLTGTHSLPALPDNVLLSIGNFCDERSLRALACTCVRLKMVFSVQIATLAADRIVGDSCASRLRVYARQQQQFAHTTTTATAAAPHTRQLLAASFSLLVCVTDRLLVLPSVATGSRQQRRNATDLCLKTGRPPRPRRHRSSHASPLFAQPSSEAQSTP